MEMFNLDSKLKTLHIEINENLLIHIILISLSTRFTQFKISYNTHINEVLMSLSHNVCKKKGLREK